MPPPNDPALERMTELVRSLVEIMRLGNLPSVDFQDERVVLLDGGKGAVGVGEATGPDRAARAVELALIDLTRQLEA